MSWHCVASLSIRDQCARAQVPFFFKQWGGVRKSKAGRELDGKTYDEVPRRVELPVLDNRRRLRAIAEMEGLGLAGDTPEAKRLLILQQHFIFHLGMSFMPGLCVRFLSDPVTPQVVFHEGDCFRLRDLRTRQGALE